MSPAHASVLLRHASIKSGNPHVYEGFDSVGLYVKVHGDTYSDQCTDPTGWANALSVCRDVK